jgi:hypothetical protein
MIKMLQNIYTKELQSIQNKYIFSPENITRMDEVFNIVTEMGYDESIFNSIQPIQDLQHDVYEFRDYAKFAIWLIAETKIPYDHLYYCYLYDELESKGYVKLISHLVYDEHSNNVDVKNAYAVAFTTERNHEIRTIKIIN